MIKPDDPRDLSVNLLTRSICNVQVGAVIVDASGRIAGWGWNSMGPTGYGLCAERHAISRTNKKRLFGAVVFIAGRWRKTEKIVNAKPCKKCEAALVKNGMIAMYRNAEDEWEVM